VVELVQPMGSETYLHLTGHTRSIIARVPAAHPAIPNQAITFTFDPRHCHFFNPASGVTLA
jgi:ABC-type sugar transport system ATPase subunit